MTKRIVAFVLLLSVFAGVVNLSASDNGAAQGTLIGTGLACLFVPMISDYLAEEGTERDTSLDWLMYTMGGVCIASGVIWMIVDLLDDDTSSSSDDGYSDEDPSWFSAKKSNPIRDHLQFGMMPGKAYLGVSFKY